MIEWYRLPQNKARNLMFPIIMSNYPVELTAGKMVKLTMNSFSNVSTQNLIIKTDSNISIIIIDNDICVII